MVQSDAIGYEEVNKGPHSLTVQGQYTIPTGQRAWLVSVYCEITRRTVYTTIGETWIEIDRGPGTMIQTRLMTNSVGAQSHFGVGECGVLEEGQTLMIATVDSSVGGACDYHGNAQVVLFRK